MDHGLGAVDAPLVVPYEASAPGHPSEGAVDDPAAWKDFEALRGIGPFDFDGEVEEGGLVHELGAVVGASGEQVLDPGPALAHAVEDHLRAGALRHAGGGDGGHQQTTVGVGGDMALASPNLLASGVTSGFRFNVRDRCDFEDAARRAR